MLVAQAISNQILEQMPQGIFLLANSDLKMIRGMLAASRQECNKTKHPLAQAIKHLGVILVLDHQMEVVVPATKVTVRLCTALDQVAQVVGVDTEDNFFRINLLSLRGILYRSNVNDNLITLLLYFFKP